MATMAASPPGDVVARLTADVARLARDPAVVEKARRAGYEWIGAGPDALLKKMAEEVAQSQDVIRFSGIRAE